MAGTTPAVSGRMSTNPIKGKTLIFNFAGENAKSYEHTFHADGSLEYGDAGSDKKTRVDKSEIAHVGGDVYAVSYVGDAGWAMTSVLDFATHKVFAFLSKDKQLMQTHGKFEAAK
jgi:hypothetical protein